MDFISLFEASQRPTCYLAAVAAMDPMDEAVEVGGSGHGHENEKLPPETEVPKGRGRARGRGRGRGKSVAAAVDLVVKYCICCSLARIGAYKFCDLLKRYNDTLEWKLSRSKKATDETKAEWEERAVIIIPPGSATFGVRASGPFAFSFGWERVGCVV